MPSPRFFALLLSILLACLMPVSYATGSTWTNRTTGTSGSGLLWQCIASSHDGSKLVAASFKSSLIPVDSGDIWTSTDAGATWMNRTTGTNASGLDWQCIASSADGSKLAVSGWGNDIWTSLDSGATWTNSTTGTSASGLKWSSIAISTDGSKFAAVTSTASTSQSLPAGVGDIWTSTDSGTTWTNRTKGTSASGHDWRSIACSVDGGKLAAVAWNTDIWTSTDSGATWVDRTRGTNASGVYWSAITSSADGLRLAAAVFEGDIWTSVDAGATWTNRTTGNSGIDATSREWLSIACSTDGGRLAAAEPDGIWTSLDAGATWTNQTANTSGSSQFWTCLATSADGLKVAASSASISVYSGDLWTSRVPLFTAILPPNGSTAGGTPVTIVGSGFTGATAVSFATTNSSATFTVLSDTLIQAVTPSGIDGPADVTITAPAGIVTGSQVYTYGAAVPQAGSPWVDRTAGTSAANQEWISIASSADGGRLASAVYFGDLWTSPDSGATWVNRTTGTSAGGNREWDTVTSSADGGNLAASENGGDIWSSMDSGATWRNCTKGTSASHQNWRTIASSSDGSRLAVVASGGDIWTSLDWGTTWTNCTGGTTASGKDWTSIASSADGNLLAAGQISGDLWTSTDLGATWTNRTTGTSASGKNWYSLTSSADGKRLTAAGSGGFVATSADAGVTWTLRSSNFSGDISWYSTVSSADGSRIALAGGSSYLFTSADGGNSWADHSSTFSGLNAHALGSAASSADGGKLALTIVYGSIYTSPDAPQLALSGNGVAIANGTGSDIADGTYFGEVALFNKQVAHTFTIRNTGTTTHNLIGAQSVTVAGLAPPEFSVTRQPALSVPVGGSTTFEITFDPALPGIRPAMMSIASNDPATPTYTFEVSGYGVLPVKLAQTLIFNPPAVVYLGQSPLLLAAPYSTSGLLGSLGLVSGPATMGPGSYQVTLTGTGIIKLEATQGAGDNYTAALPVDRFITVKADPKTLTLVNLNQTYDGTPKLVTTLGSTGTPILITYKTGTTYVSAPPIKAGSYPVKAVAGNTSVTGTLVITKAPLYVTPADQHKFAGQPNPALTFSYGGFGYGDTAETAITKAPVISTTATATSLGGTYPITASGGLTANYTFIHQQGTMVVDTFAGSYEALLLDGDLLPAALLDVTVATNTTFTASLHTPTEVAAVRFTGKLVINIATGLATGTALTVVQNATPYVITFALPTYGNVTASATGYDNLPIGTASDGQKLSALPVAFAGAHTAVLEPPTLALPIGSFGTNVPAGAGWATASISTTGVLTLAGKLPDGTAFTTALNPDGRANPGYRLFLQPYLPARLVSFIGGSFNLLPHPVLTNRRYLPQAPMTWNKTGLATDSSYRADFGLLTTVLMIDPWLPPAAATRSTPAIPLAQRLGLTGTSISFAVSIGATGSASDASLPTRVALSPTNLVSVLTPVTIPVNVTKWTTALVPTTGVFTGSFELVDGALKRPVTFSGVLRQPATAPDTLIGDGHYLLPPPTGTEKSTGEVMFQRP